MTAPSLVAANSLTTAGGGSSTTVAKAYASNLTAGSCLIALVGSESNVTHDSVADGTNGAWTLVVDSGLQASAYRISIWKFVNTTGGVTPTVTATFSAGAIGRSICIREVKDADTSSPVEASSAGIGVSTALTGLHGTAGARQVTAAGAAVTLTGTVVNQAPDVGAGSGFTRDKDVDPNFYARFGYNVQAAGQTYDPAWFDISLIGGANFADAVVVVKGATAAGFFGRRYYDMRDSSNV